MPTLSTRVALAFAGFQAVDAVACAIPLDYIKADLDHLRCPEALQQALPAIKGASAVGLVAGLKFRRLGALTSMGLVGYFICAVALHMRAKDAPLRAAPAGFLGLLSLFHLVRVYRPH